MADNKMFAIGVFDSGLGGLTVVKEIMRCLPFEDIVYYGDTARVPYGTKSKNSIIRFSLENAKILLKHKVKILVVACNSSSSVALPQLKKNLDLPVVGVITPSVRKAAQMTRNKKVGVIATQATVSSRAYDKILNRYRPSVKIFTQACPLFVPLVEEGWANNGIATKTAERYLAQLKKKKIDTLILGCTHYPLLKTVLRKTVGKNVIFIDSAVEVAREVKQVLVKVDLLNPLKKKSTVKILVSDRPQSFEKNARDFLDCNIKKIVKVDNV